MCESVSVCLFYMPLILTNENPMLDTQRRSERERETDRLRDRQTDRQTQTHRDGEREGYGAGARDVEERRGRKAVISFS